MKTIVKYHILLTLSIVFRYTAQMDKIINKDARHNYEFLEDWEAGIVLSGAEVKSIKHGRMNLKGAYVSIRDNEMWLIHAHVSAWQPKNQPTYNPDQDRKLLLRKSEINRIIGKLNEKGLTIVPETVYSKAGLIKVKLQLARGLKSRDKRQKIKDRDIKRDMARAMKQ